MLTPCVLIHGPCYCLGRGFYLSWRFKHSFKVHQVAFRFMLLSHAVRLSYNTPCVIRKEWMRRYARRLIPASRAPSPSHDFNWNRCLQEPLCCMQCWGSKSPEMHDWSAGLQGRSTWKLQVEADRERSFVANCIRSQESEREEEGGRERERVRRREREPYGQSGYYLPRWVTQ